MTITANVAKTLVRAPRIAILRGGNEAIAFNNLNAAGIPDSTGATWTNASPDLLTEADVAGPTTTSLADGVLFHANGQPRYCHLASMHYNSSSLQNDVIAEVRSWLNTSSSSLAFMQCQATSVFENSASGHFLTTNGIASDSKPSFTSVPAGAHPLVQMSGTFKPDSGTVDGIKLAGGSGFRTGVTTLIHDTSKNLLNGIVLLTGRLDGQSTERSGHLSDRVTITPLSCRSALIRRPTGRGFF